MARQWLAEQAVLHLPADKPGGINWGMRQTAQPRGPAQGNNALKLLTEKPLGNEAAG